MSAVTLNTPSSPATWRRIILAVLFYLLLIGMFLVSFVTLISDNYFSKWYEQQDYHLQHQIFRANLSLLGIDANETNLIAATSMLSGHERSPTVSSSTTVIRSTASATATAATAFTTTLMATTSTTTADSLSGRQLVAEQLSTLKPMKTTKTTTTTTITKTATPGPATTIVADVYGGNTDRWACGVRIEQQQQQQKQQSSPQHRHRRNKRIINGEQAAQDSWPWEARIFRILRNGKRTFVNSATLIHRQFLLSRETKHSSNSSQLLVIFGSSSSSSSNATGTNDTAESETDTNDAAAAADDDERIYSVSDTLMHPQFNGSYTHTPSLTLLRLTRPVQERSGAVPVCLPELPRDAATVIGHNVTVLGWGATFSNTTHNEYALRLQQVVLRVLDPDSAVETGNNSNSNSSNSSSSNSNSSKLPCSVIEYDRQMHYCAAEANATASSCYRDSSMHYLDVKTQRWYLYGVLSFFVTEFKACDARKPSYFVKVPNYLEWIRQQIAQHL